MSLDMRSLVENTLLWDLDREESIWIITLPFFSPSYSGNQFSAWVQNNQVNRLDI